MIKDNQKILNKLYVLIDAVIVASSYILAWFIHFESIFSDFFIEPGEGYLNMEQYFQPMWFLVPGYLILYYAFNMYKPKRATGRQFEVVNILKANTVGFICFIGTLYMLKERDFSRSMIILFYIVNSVLTILARLFIRKLLRLFRKKGYNVKHILLVGYSRAAEAYIDRIVGNPQWGYHICGVLDNHIPAGTLYKGIKVLGRIDNLEIILPENKLDEIAITLALADYDHLEELVAMCEKSGVHTKFIPDYNSLIPGRPYTEDLNGLPVINIRYVPLTNTLNIVAKRMIDIIGSLCGIVIFSPIMLIVAVLIKCSGPGPVIFKQERVGLHNKTFQMYKFRTMKLQAPEEEQKGWTVKGDPRVTKVGRFLRKTSLDEIPQLFNILIGNMSLVGPRPERPQFVEQFKEEIPRYMVKHQVRPGLTGWAQVNGYRGILPFGSELSTIYIILKTGPCH